MTYSKLEAAKTGQVDKLAAKLAVVEARRQSDRDSRMSEMRRTIMNDSILTNYQTITLHQQRRKFEQERKLQEREALNGKAVAPQIVTDQLPIDPTQVAARFRKEASENSRVTT